MEVEVVVVVEVRRRALVAVLQRELDWLEEEQLALKTENRKLAHQCGGRAAKFGLKQVLDVDWIICLEIRNLFNLSI